MKTNEIIGFTWNIARRIAHTYRACRASVFFAARVGQEKRGTAVSWAENSTPTMSSRRFFLDIAATGVVYAGAKYLDASPTVGISWLAELAGIKQSWAGGNVVYYRGADYVEVDGKSYPVHRDINGDINIVINGSMQLRISK